MLFLPMEDVIREINVKRLDNLYSENVDYQDRLYDVHECHMRNVEEIYKEAQREFAEFGYGI